MSSKTRVFLPNEHRLQMLFEVPKGSAPVEGQTSEGKQRRSLVMMKISRLDPEASELSETKIERARCRF